MSIPVLAPEARPAPDAVAGVVQRVADALARPDGLAPHAPPGGRRAASLDGSAGVALLHLELARHDSAHLGVAHAHVAAAARSLTADARAVGLHSGPAAVLAAVQGCARLGGHYPQLRVKLAQLVAEQQLVLLAREQAQAERDGGVRWAAYDAIVGPVGTGRTLLTAVVEGGTGERAAAEPALRATLDHLVRLTVPVERAGHRIPGWWVPGHCLMTEADREDFPRGEVNTGLAHGICGPLALLTLAAEQGVTVEGHLDAIRTIGDWLAARVRNDAAGPYWEPRLSFDDEVAGGRTGASGHEGAPTMASWCYGPAGIAPALHRAARLAGDDRWRRVALDSLHAIFRRDEAPWQLSGPTVCHGLAGLLPALCRLGRAEGDAGLLGHANTVAGSIVQLAEDDAPFVFRHLGVADPSTWRRGKSLERLDAPGVLEGAAGVAAALLALSEAGGAYWDRVLLLS
ncbi:lanthionine synthetase C family protein [Streptomyces sp. NPDC050095]|uniref:lanthionine synthetase C family protein n=1 Tax=unclassified Streptomyces TaxID=2593676 RepID=UPI0034474DB3